MPDLFRRFDGYDDLKPLLEGSAEEVLLRLGVPALIRIPGVTESAERRPARFVSCLLHGNEDSGYRAVLHLLRRGERWPFDLWVLIGNVRAASEHGWFAHRYLDDQEDFNRVWGRSEPTTKMRQCADEILELLLPVNLEAAIDLHNTTGDNPPHAILPTSSRRALHLAATCADTVLRWSLLAYTLMEALTPHCPAVAVECGAPGRSEGVAFADDVLVRFLAARDFGEGAAEPRRLYEMRHRVIVRHEVAFAFGGPLGELDLVLQPGLDGHNFGMLLAGTVIGKVRPRAAVPVLVTDMEGHDVTEKYFRVRPGGTLVVQEDITPVMMTNTVQQTRRDCLFYIARRRT
jgi:hypothetical protein